MPRRLSRDLDGRRGTGLATAQEACCPLPAKLSGGRLADRQAGAVGLGFGGEVAEFYARFRRGYPAAVLDAVVAEFGLTGQDVVVDLGCGTGQLTLPLARRVRAVVGMDPEPGMLVLAQRAAAADG